MLRHGSCLGTRRRLGDLCDAELPPAVERRVRRHLAGCRRCARALARLRSTIAEVASLAARPVPNLPPQRGLVLARIAQETATPAGPGDGDRGPEGAP